MKGLKVLTTKEWVISHVFIFAGLVLISLWLRASDPPWWRVAVFGIWFLAGGVCWIAAYALRHLMANRA